MHSLCFKLVGSQDVSQRHYFVLVDWQQVLWNILKQATTTKYINLISQPVCE